MVFSAHKSLLAGMRTLLWQGPDGILKIADGEFNAAPYYATSIHTNAKW
jgi:hypothetical protein